MESLPTEIKTREIALNLPYESIIYLCQTNNEFSRMCQSNEFWEQLVIRDFGIYDARKSYLLTKQALDRFSKIFPIITQRVLELLVNPAAVSKWDDIEASLLHEQAQWPEDDNLTILSIDMLKDIVDNEDDNGQYIMENYRTRDILITLISEPHLIYPDFDQIVEDLNQTNCKDFRRFISTPTRIFVNTKPILIKYDHDLAEALARHSEADCSHQLDDIITETADLLEL